MQPTADDFRALARSSPWRWTTLHFTRSGDLGEVEAWVRRPSELVVKPRGLPEQYVQGIPYSTSGAVRASDPVFRPDGLVAERSPDWHFGHGDAMWHNYTWTAMLDPDELSHHVEVQEVRAEERATRQTWVARLRPEVGYDPRCGCCPLLWSEISVRAEYDGDTERLALFAAQGYPDAYDVALDVQTGVVVVLDPVGGGTDRGFSLQIHRVDDDLDAVFAQSSASRME